MAGSDEDTDERTDEGKNAETIGAFNMTHKLPTHFESSTSANSMLQKHSKFNPEHCRRTVLQKQPNTSSCYYKYGNSGALLHRTIRPKIK